MERRQRTKRATPRQKCIGCEMKEVNGRPDPKHVSTLFVERQNWSVRTGLRRYTRLSNGFLRKRRKSCGCDSSQLFRLSLIKIHRTLRTSTATAGLTDRLWEVSDLAALWESYQERRAERAVA